MMLPHIETAERTADQKSTTLQSGKMLRQIGRGKPGFSEMLRQIGGGKPGFSERETVGGETAQMHHARDRQSCGDKLNHIAMLCTH